MTDVLGERRVRADSTVTRRSLTSTALLAGGGAALVGVSLVAVVVMAVWVTGTRSDSSLTDVLHVAGLAWLACHRAPVTVPGGVIGVLPLALLAVPLWLCSRAGRWAVRVRDIRTTGQAAAVIAAAAVIYAALAVVVAWASSQPRASVSLVSAAVACGAVAALGLAVGIARESGLGAQWWRSLPERARTVLVGVGVGAFSLLAVGAVVSLVGMVVHLHEVTSLTRAVGVTPVGILALGLLGAAYAPTAAGWGVAYVSGIGIDLGAAAHATPFSVVPGALPTLPWLAALPSATPALGWLLLLAPVACGAAVALAVHRRSSQWPLWQEVCLLFGAVAGVAVVVAAGMAVAGGGLGPGRLSTVGPAPLSVAGACGALVLIGAVTTLGVTRLSQWVLNHRNPDPGAR